MAFRSHCQHVENSTLTSGPTLFNGISLTLQVPIYGHFSKWPSVAVVYTARESNGIVGMVVWIQHRFFHQESRVWVWPEVLCELGESDSSGNEVSKSINVHNRLTDLTWQTHDWLHSKVKRLEKVLSSCVCKCSLLFVQRWRCFKRQMEIFDPHGKSSHRSSGGENHLGRMSRSFRKLWRFLYHLKSYTLRHLAPHQPLAQKHSFQKTNVSTPLSTYSFFHHL